MHNNNAGECTVLISLDRYLSVCVVDSGPVDGLQLQADGLLLGGDDVLPGYSVGLNNSFTIKNNTNKNKSTFEC